MDERQRKLVEELLSSEKERPSFAKLLYYGIFDSSKVFPYPTLSKEEVEVTEENLRNLNNFAEHHIDAAHIDHEATLDSPLIQGLSDLGILGYTVPTSFGGRALSQTSYCHIMERLARACAATALFVNAHHSIGLRALLLFGTEAQKERWLKPLATGKVIAAFALTEPHAGSDAGGIETTATYNPEKKTYTLKGQKQWITNGSIAGVLTVMAKTDDKVTAFLVTPDMPGFKIKDKALEKVGMRGSTTSNLIFDNVEVPEENILGPKGKGLKVCLTVLDYGRTTFGATCTGTAKYLLECALDHSKKRFQFGRPLASFPLVKQKIARMAAYTYAMDATTYLTAGLLDSNEKDIMLEAAILKVFASTLQWECVYETMQIFGGRSFFTDYPFERIMRDSRLNMIGEGANEVLQAFIAVVGLRDVGLHLQKTGSLSLLYELVRKIPAPTVPVQSRELKKSAKGLSYAVRRFGYVVIKELIKHREGIIEKQLVLDRLATALTSLYSLAAVMGKIDQELIAGKRENLDVALLYCDIAFGKFKRALMTMDSPRDKMVEKVSDTLTGISP